MQQWMLLAVFLRVWTCGGTDEFSTWSVLLIFAPTCVAMKPFPIFSSGLTSFHTQQYDSTIQQHLHTYTHKQTYIHIRSMMTPLVFFHLIPSGKCRSKSKIADSFNCSETVVKKIVWHVCKLFEELWFFSLRLK
jgi:hypothetical protein